MSNKASINGGHYKTTSGMESIDIIDMVTERLIEGKATFITKFLLNRTVKRFKPSDMFNIGNAIKYLYRAGNKPGEDVFQDVFKAGNYLYRACTGRWYDKKTLDELRSNWNGISKVALLDDMLTPLCCTSFSYRMIQHINVLKTIKNVGEQKVYIHELANIIEAIKDYMINE